MSPTVLNKIPEEVREHVKMLLSVTPNVRPDADQMTKVCYIVCMNKSRILLCDRMVHFILFCFPLLYRYHFLMTSVR